MHGVLEGDYNTISLRTFGVLRLKVIHPYMFLNIKMTYSLKISYQLYAFNTTCEYLLFLLGIATGSIYCSDTIKKDFIGECSMSSNVAVIKTHVRWDNTVPLRYKKSVLLIRNPYDAIIAEFNRVFANKTASATEQQFTGIITNSFLHSVIYSKY